MVAFAEADVLHLRADLQHGGGALHLEAFDDGDRIAVGKDRAVGILHDQFFFFLNRFGGRPFVGAFRADELTAVFVGIFGMAFRAGRQSAHGRILSVVGAESPGPEKAGILTFVSNRVRQKCGIFEAAAGPRDIGGSSGSRLQCRPVSITG